MNVVINPRQRSRRRIAALSFLSNISLDGSYKETEANNENIEEESLLAPEVPAVDLSAKSEKEVKENRERSTIFSTPPIDIKIHHEDSTSRSQGKGSSIDFIDNDAHCGPCHERNTDTNILCENRCSIRKRITTYHVPLVDKSQYFSSSESLIGPIQNVSGRSRKHSSSVSDSSGPTYKEVKFVKVSCDQPIKDERVILLSSCKVPFHVFSSLPYSSRTKQTGILGRSEGSRRRHASGSRPLSTISDGADPSHILGIDRFDDTVVEVSYSQLLVSSRSLLCNLRSRGNSSTSERHNLTGHPRITRCLSYEPHRTASLCLPQSPRLHDKGSVAGWRPSPALLALHRASEADVHYSRRVSWDWEEQLRCPSSQPPNYIASIVYVPNVLDDPELRAGKHRKLLRFPSYMTSLIDYTKPSELKKELNDKFREKFPYIQLTLSKLRSLKREMLKIARQNGDIDLLTVAHAFVYFERIILKTIVNKQNRKLVAGACLILSAKMNDVKGEHLSNLIERVEGTFRLNRRDLIQWEFASLVALEFGLHLPMWQVNPHYQRLLLEA